jgi:hypothetical protein
MKHRIGDIVVLKTMRELKRKFFIVEHSNSCFVYDSQEEFLNKMPGFKIGPGSMFDHLGRPFEIMGFSASGDIFFTKGFNWPIDFINEEETIFEYELPPVLQEIKLEIGIR